MNRRSFDTAPMPVPGMSGVRPRTCLEGTRREGLRRRLRRRRLALRGEPRAARRRRGLGVRPRAASTSTRSTRDGLRLSGAGDVVGRVRATTDAGELPPCDFGIVATKAMHTSAAVAATAHAFADGVRRVGAERPRQRGGDRRARRARDPRHDVSRPGRVARARARAVGRQGRHDLRPVRAAARAAGRDRAPRRRVHARRDADAARSRTREGRSGAR